MPNYIVMDCETTIKGGKERGASPFFPANRAVLWGSRVDDVKGVSISPHPPHIDPSLIVVGHNLKFDLIYHIKHSGAIQLLHQNMLWDTQLAEYLLTGQQSTFSKLDDLAVKYGGTLKDSRVSDMFAAGKGADEIDEEILIPYLTNDINNTELVFKCQFAQAERLGMLPLIMSQMAAYAATTYMTYKGLTIDVKELSSGRGALLIRKEGIVEAINHFLTNDCYVDDTIVNVSSNQQLATLLFGGDIEYTVKEEIGVYKTGAKAGMPKFKAKKVKHTLPNRVVPKNTWKTETGAWKVDREVLEEIIYDKSCRSASTALFLSKMLELSDVDKQLSTYYGGIEKALYLNGELDAVVHPDFNHCVTKTGRLSSSNPNLQNIPRGGNSEVKRAFISSFKGGKLVEIDYSQLEIIGLAIMSGDLQLRKDLVTGTDIHTALYEDMYKRKPTKQERTAFKPLTFGLVYGAGASTLAKNAKCTKDTAKLFVETFYKRYKGVKAWQDSFAATVNTLRKPSTFKDDRGFPVGAATYAYAPTGRRYVFREYPAPEWTGKSHSFSPTELKNYPVQGLSTGDIVPLMLGEVFLALKNNERLHDKCLMINTVHDSILFDCHPDIVDEAIDFLKGMINNTPMFFQRRFGVALPFERMECGVSVGSNWFDQTELK